MTLEEDTVDVFVVDSHKWWHWIIPPRTVDSAKFLQDLILDANAYSVWYIPHFRPAVWLQTILDLLLMRCNRKPWMFDNGMSMRTCLFAHLLLKFLPCYRTWQNHRGGVSSGHNQDSNLHQHLHVVSLTANVRRILMIAWKEG